MSTALLLSGGMDSIALAYWKRPTIGVTIDYGQLPAEGEIQAAKQVAQVLGIQHEIIRVDCRALGAGDLIGDQQLDDSPTPEWWPYRNQLLLTLAAMKVIRYGVQELMIGTVASDNVHRDGQPAFVQLADQLTSFQEGGIRISAPALELTAADLVRTSGIPRSILCFAHSCHTAPTPCGECRGCTKYRTTMQELYWEEGLEF
jgi:7-cyano-7-deazaguanine synthase